MTSDHGDIPADLEEAYLTATERSRELHHEAREHLPGGNSRTTLHFEPYPLYIEDAEGCRVTDADGNEYVDFFNNATSLIHGHAPESVTEAAAAAARSGSAPGGPTPSEIDLAAHLTDRIASVDRVRFTNSGTEATMHAVRAARAYTGESTIAKFEGIYHGTHDVAQVSVAPPVHLAGPAEDPTAVPDSAGVHPAVTEDTVVVPFNSVAATREKLERHADDLAGVLIHPLMGINVIPAGEEFVAMLEEFTDAHDVPLIFDEVVSFRIAHGGAQERYGVEPDITALGKVIGGGFPAGAVGGREDIMSLFDPTAHGEIAHGGTFNANPVTMRAGLTAMEEYDRDAVKRVNGLAASLVERAREVFREHAVEARVNRSGSLFNVYFSDQPVTDYRSRVASSSREEQRLFHLLLNEGVRLSPGLMGAVSTPMTESEVDGFVDALGSAVERL